MVVTSPKNGGEVVQASSISGSDGQYEPAPSKATGYYFAALYNTKQHLADPECAQTMSRQIIAFSECACGCLTLGYKANISGTALSIVLL